MARPVRDEFGEFRPALYGGELLDDTLVVLPDTVQRRPAQDLDAQLGDVVNIGIFACGKVLAQDPCLGATLDLGEHKRVVLVSVPEGPDKPAKYPKAFTSSQVFLITKTDLLPYFDFEVAEASKEALTLNPSLQVMDFSSTTGEGFDVWLDYLRELVKEVKQK